jgi:hypothetical protein
MQKIVFAMNTLKSPLFAGFLISKISYDDTEFN